MPQLLLELFSEEIPARMQAQAARDLERMARDGLGKAGLISEGLKAFAGPRRLTLVVEGLPIAQPDVHEELKGPKANAPEQALEGFLRKTGLTREQLTEKDGVLFAHVHKAGRPTPEIIAELVEQIVRGFPWPKSMTWGHGKLRWVRPLQRILCVFNREVVPLSIDGIVAGDLSEGHRFMAETRVFRAREFDEYAEALAGHYVVLDVEERKQRILEGARTLCFAQGLELVEDEGLLDEVAGLAEWPTPILGDMDPAFLSLPPEVIRTSMRTHQKYFAVRKPGEAGLAPKFLVVSNNVAPDGGVEIARGNAKVLSSRLSDAKFFWAEDVKDGFEPWLEKLNGVTFHAKLGTMAERVERIVALAREIAPLVGANADKAAEAARLAKADLASQMVGEFPELQGIMGGYYAREFGLETDIADAIRDHYRPQGPGDSVPTAPLSVAVALADKLDTLVGFFAIDEKPTGSKDPYALRRAALGVIRIILSHNARIELGGIGANGPLLNSYGMLAGQVSKRKLEAAVWKLFQLEKELDIEISGVGPQPVLPPGGKPFWERWWVVKDEILAFLADRLKVLLRDQGKRHDLVDAVFALKGDDLVSIVARVDALSTFLATDDGVNLLAGYKRAANILKAEEKKGPLPTGEPVRAAEPAEEGALFDALAALGPKLDAALAAEDFTGAMTALAGLRAPVDAFFDKVLVNSDVAAERENRLRLLQQVQGAMGRVADFSLVTG
ncbi:glycine--tRNA ligase subunit beta [Caulobacter mirabilis]|uniref:Glycine--tRNA ligase beta subunit n=1 Tax=Caulobacter mirabilis TaxID=69666 RepID=A0A2D2AZQ8_9CAUL|nr:glycine--tRNA ligase subunit beta [Caulobacter mirabilis]ATQ43475.1 glycine--tRNA ligase subunit beta [Caulobacter mirabilis]